MHDNGTTAGWPDADIANETGEVEDPELARFRFAVHAVVVPILFASITVIGLAGNSLVVYAVSTRRRLRTVTNLLLLNLAVADLCFVTVVPPFTAYEYVAGEIPRSSWSLGDAVCRLLHYLVNVTAYVTVYTLTMIAAVRYATIVHSARTARWRTRRNVGRAIIGLWVVVMTVNVPILLSYSVKVRIDFEVNDCVVKRCAFSVLPFLCVSINRSQYTSDWSICRTLFDLLDRVDILYECFEMYKLKHISKLISSAKGMFFEHCFE